MELRSRVRGRKFGYDVAYVRPNVRPLHANRCYTTKGLDMKFML